MANQIEPEFALNPALIVLAGGLSSRMGRPKALLPFRGHTWLEAQLESFARAGGRDAIVVVGDVVRRELSWIDDALAGSARVGDLTVRAAHQPRPEDGAFSSLQLALRLLGARAAYVLPIDVPVSPATWPALASAIGAREAAVPTHLGRRGHPVLVSAPFAARLAAIAVDAVDARLDRQLARADRVEVERGDPTVLVNLNTEEAWSRWLRGR